MYFLGGDRIYIKPQQAGDSLEEQIQNGLAQLQQINSEKKVFKLNFFVDTASDNDYRDLKSAVLKEIRQRFSDEFLVSFIAQPPLNRKVIIEAFYYDPASWQKTVVTVGENKAAQFENAHTRFLIGVTAANDGANCRENTLEAFSALQQVFAKQEFKICDIVRQWNYLEDILGYDGDQQRYQEFNNVRAEVYADAFTENGYPAATGIGMNRGGIIIQFIAVQSDEVVSKPVDNPDQISAHKYSDEVLVGSECVLKATPKFERARYLGVDARKMIMISGTASIIGERTVGIDDPEKQTEVTIENLKRLYSPAVLQRNAIGSAGVKFGHARVYVKNKSDYPIIQQTLKKHLGDLPAVYILADVCRDDLLVEIEGKVILA